MIVLDDERVRVRRHAVGRVIYALHHPHDRSVVQVGCQAAEWCGPRVQGLSRLDNAPSYCRQ